MPFLRLKKINNQQYCYLVENKHTKNGPRQKVKKYLGKVLGLEKKKDLDFFEYFKINDLNNYFKKNKKEILSDLIKFELVKHGFKEKRNFLINQHFSFNKKTFQLLKNKKEIVLFLNQGFLSAFTFKRILSFRKTRDFSQDAHALAKYFIEAGINIPKEIFIRFYQKCWNHLP